MEDNEGSHMENDREVAATRGDILDLEDRLTKKWRDMQTELLKAFYSFAESNQKRLSE